ncbi:MAG: nidogen-like domain-containing protein [Sandaracinaceae bacterium]
MTARSLFHAQRSLLQLSCALAISLLPRAAMAAPLITGLGGPAGFGSSNLPGNDDGSTGEIDILPAFPSGLHFFSATYDSLWVNNNGNVSFGGSLGTFTPSPFPIASQPMIAPWWGDVDTRGGGTPTRNGVYWSITPGRMIVTWHNVGYFSTHDNLQNDFQMILTAAPPGIGDFDVEFRYNRCEWTTGDASGGSGGFGGTPAQAGFDAGNLTDYVALPGSLTMRVLDLCTTSNVGTAGVWRFEIRGGEIMCPGRGDPCMTGELGVCAQGTMVCISPDEAECRQNTRPSEEVCNGLDDDCNGATDELLGTTTCGAGECVVSVENCVGGRPQACVPRPPAAELCNFLDDDCDGVVDDLDPLVCGVGACRVTTLACIDGVPGECVPLPGSPEVCNGLDDDCDGEVDDGLIGCIPPDAGPPDGGVTADGGGPRDGAVCEGPRSRCDPWQLEGRAGPIGNCRCGAVGGTEGGTRGGSVALLALFAVVVQRRRRRG